MKKRSELIDKLYKALMVDPAMGCTDKNYKMPEGLPYGNRVMHNAVQMEIAEYVKLNTLHRRTSPIRRNLWSFNNDLDSVILRMFNFK